jgi:hypothetical protein
MLRGIYPLSAITDGVGLNMSLMSYNGTSTSVSWPAAR